jgi:hypothetical protein
MDPRHFVKPNGVFSRKPRAGEAFEEFNATELYCARCKQSVPVRKRLLLILPEGDKYEYLCAYCAATVGTKIDHEQEPPAIIS